MRKRAICRRSRPFLSLKPFGPGGVRTSRGTSGPMKPSSLPPTRATPMAGWTLQWLTFDRSMVSLRGEDGGAGRSVKASGQRTAGSEQENGFLLAARCSLPATSGQIEKENLRPLGGDDRERRLVLDRGAVAGFEGGAVHVDAAAHDLEAGAAAGRERVLDALAAIEGRGVDLGVLMDVQRAIFAVRRDQQPE